MVVGQPERVKRVLYSSQIVYFFQSISFKSISRLQANTTKEFSRDTPVTLLLFNFVLNCLSDAYPDYAASVFAGDDFIRSSFDTAFSLFAGAMYKNL
jgi:hypothetical protein